MAEKKIRVGLDQTRPSKTKSGRFSLAIGFAGAKRLGIREPNPFKKVVLLSQDCWRCRRWQVQFSQLAECYVQPFAEPHRCSQWFAPLPVVQHASELLLGLFCFFVRLDKARQPFSHTFNVNDFRRIIPPRSRNCCRISTNSYHGFSLVDLIGAEGQLGR
jgi:hypothetical protein